MGHHSTSDDSSAYRSKEEVADWQKRDSPINRFRAYLEKKGLWNEEKDKEYRKVVRADILKAFAAAEKRKKPSVNELFTDVYDVIPPHLEKQRKELDRIVKKYPQFYDKSGHTE